MNSEMVCSANGDMFVRSSRVALATNLCNNPVNCLLNGFSVRAGNILKCEAFSVPFDISPSCSTIRYLWFKLPILFLLVETQIYVYSLVQRIMVKMNLRWNLLALSDEIISKYFIDILLLLAFDILFIYDTCCVASFIGINSFQMQFFVITTYPLKTSWPVWSCSLS